MKIRVDFYRPSGKWYEGGEVEIGNAKLWRGDLPQAIVNNQNILTDGWQEQDCYYVVTSDLIECDNDDLNCYDFVKALFLPDKFKGLKRRN